MGRGLYGGHGNICIVKAGAMDRQKGHGCDEDMIRCIAIAMGTRWKEGSVLVLHLVVTACALSYRRKKSKYLLSFNQRLVGFSKR
jgi:hypothetical protein